MKFNIPVTIAIDMRDHKAACENVRFFCADAEAKYAESYSIVSVDVDDDFMSMREFFLLKENSRSVHKDQKLLWDRKKNECSESILEDGVIRYDIAQTSWKKFGAAGPPAGTIVEMLHSGHGGGVGALRTMEGIWEGDDRYFNVSRMTKRSQYCEIEKEVSLVDRKTWFAEMREHVENV